MSYSPQHYLVFTKKDGKYPVENPHQGVWLITGIGTPKEIQAIGKTPAQEIVELTNVYVGKKILYKDKLFPIETEPIISIKRM